MLKNLPILIILIPILIFSLAGNVYLLLNKTSDTENLLKQISELQKNRDRQKAEKDQIRRFWEDQASLNDNLVASQQDVLSEVRNFIAEIDRSIRFVNTGPQFLPTISQDNLQNVQNTLKDRINSLEKTIEKNGKVKQNTTDAIDAIYKNGGEDQNNRANPRDGVRN